MIRKAISVIFALSILTTLAHAYTAVVENCGTSTYKSVRITPEIYNNANEDLSDLVLKDSQENRVSYFINEASLENAESLETFDARFDTEEKDGDTHISIHGVKNLRINEILIETDSSFKRTVVEQETGISKDLVKLNMAGINLNDTEIELSGERIKGDACTLVIQNMGDMPINIQGIKVQYLADEIVFEDKAGGNYTIEFGGKAEAIDNDELLSRREEILSGEIDKLEIKSIKTVGEQGKENNRAAAPYIIAALVIVLAFMLFTRIRKK